MQEQPNKIDAPKRLLVRRLAVWITMGAVVVVTATALWQLKFNKYRLHETRYGVTVTDKASEEKANKARDSAVAKTHTVRDAWRSWAWQHKTLLAAMLTASPNDKEAMVRVYDALPSTPEPLGINSLFKLPASNDVENGALSFTWQPLDKLNTSGHYTDAKAAAKDKMFEAFMANTRQKNFARYRDIELSKSVSLGGTKLTLWASGRVTEESRVRQFKPGGRAWADGPKKEILPPYDFLRNVSPKS